jgi:hypothetical protein
LPTVDFRLSIDRKTKFENRKWKLAEAEVKPTFDFPVSSFGSSSRSAILHRQLSPIVVCRLSLEEALW